MMGDMILLCSIAIFFVLGYFVMDKLDHILEKIQELNPKSPGPVNTKLFIAFSNPLILISVSETLDRLSDERLLSEYYLYTGKPGEVLKRLSDQKADIAFLPYGIKLEEFPEYQAISLTMEYNKVTQQMIWRKTGGSNAVNEFVSRITSQSAVNHKVEGNI